jgi:hypothetical protein
MWASINRNLRESLLDCSVTAVFERFAELNDAVHSQECNPMQCAEYDQLRELFGSVAALEGRKYQHDLRFRVN